MFKRIIGALLFVGLLSVPSYSGADISAPTGVTATEGTYSDTLIVTWNEVPGVYGYEVWRDSYEWCQGAIPCEPEFILYGEVFDNNGIWDRRDILPFGQVFEYRIKACDNDAITNEWICSDFSLPAYGYVLEDAPILPGPTGVTATEGTYSNAIIISWDPVPGASGYEVWAINSSEYDCGEQPEPCEPRDFIIGTPNDTDFDYGWLRNLSFDVIYEFRVKASFDDSTSDFSLPAYGFVQLLAPFYDFIVIDIDGCIFKNCWGEGGGGGIFGDIIRSSVIGYHLDGFTTKGVQVYMPVTPGFKALKGAQEYVRSFAPNLAEFVRKCFDFFEQKADANKEGLLYNTGTHVFPLLGKIAEKSLELI